MQVLRRMRILLGGSRESISAGRPFHRQSAAYRRAVWLVRLFYWVTLFLVLERLALNWKTWLALEDLVAPLWSVRWLQLLDLRTGIAMLGLMAIGGGVCGAIFPETRWARAAAALGFFLLVSFENSFGKINHSTHGWVFATLILVALPAGPWDDERQRITRQRFLTVIWGAQALFLLFFTMSGVVKILVGFQQMWYGSVSTFHPEALALHVAARTLQTGESPVLAPLLLRWPVLGWPLYLGAVYLETFSLVVAFRPALHRIWGISLMLFHIGNLLLMNISFSVSVLLLGFLLVYSPQTPLRIEWKQVWRSLPVIGDLFGLIRLERYRIKSSG